MRIIVEFYVIVDNLLVPQYSEACAAPNGANGGSGRYISARFQKQGNMAVVVPGVETNYSIC